MGNSESTCSPHEDACKEAETKLEECALAHLASKVDEIATKGFKGFEAAFNDDYNKYTDYMIGGACKESYMNWVESTNNDSGDLIECVEAHSDYYHKFIDFYKGVQEQGIQVMKEFDSIMEEESPIRAQECSYKEFFGDCCKEQFSALLKCLMKQI
ncbi:unnamed protein product [Brassica napus]|uniref:(rape) hypothetical protein n=1 Tax=Brassica napus TaxID=3708 RepID=A0A816PSL2_BRANA|nr:unnamed protein product [Brassica napus]